MPRNECGVARFKLRHQLQRDRNHIDDNEKNDQPADHAARPISDRPVLQDFVEAMPQRAPPVSPHINPSLRAAARRNLAYEAG